MNRPFCLGKKKKLDFPIIYSSKIAILLRLFGIDKHQVFDNLFDASIIASRKFFFRKGDEIEKMEERLAGVPSSKTLQELVEIRVYG